jgi:tetratricopeptide (TPR) repeat protein
MSHGDKCIIKVSRSMKGLTGALILMFLCLTLSAQDNTALIEKGNKDYAAGLYHNAIEDYLKVVGNGYESPELYYNLGNAYFKANDLPSAILYYEKAKKLKPNDADINFNLHIANSRIVDKIDPVPQLFYIRWWKSLYHFFDVNGWAWFNVATFILLLALIITVIISRKALLRRVTAWLAVVVLVIFFFSLGFSLQTYHSFKKASEAIVFNPSVTVKSSPSENSIDLFVVHEGTKVKITDTVGDWYEIRIANGSVGWMKAASVKKI